MRAPLRRLGLLAAAVVLASVAIDAANIDKALADAESRRKAAENGLRDIKKIDGGGGDEVRMAYTTAATQNNAWLDQVCQAVEGSAPTTPDTTSTAAAAADALVDWVAIRNRALDVPVMTNEIAASLKKSIARDLIDIAEYSWKTARGADVKRRTALTAALKERLRWNTWDNVR